MTDRPDSVARSKRAGRVVIQPIFDRSHFGEQEVVLFPAERFATDMREETAKDAARELTRSPGGIIGIAARLLAIAQFAQQQGLIGDQPRQPAARRRRMAHRIEQARQRGALRCGAVQHVTLR